MSRDNLLRIGFLLSIFVALAVGCARKSGTGVTPASAPPAKVEKASLMVFAGAANKPPLTELCQDFEKANNCVVNVTFAGSGMLLTQITTEKVGDVYVPGSDDFMQKGKEKGAIDAASERLVAWLVPVINVAKGNPKGIKGLEDLAKPGVKVCLADAKAVCLGAVADQILQAAGLEERVKKNVVTYALSCEEVENRVETGEVDAAIGWDVFDHWAPEKIENVPIPKVARRYISAAVVAFSSQKELAQKFVDFVSSSQGNAVYSKYGYTVPVSGEAVPANLGK